MASAHACAVCGDPLCTRCDRGSRYVSLCRAHEDIRVLQGWAEVARPSGEPRAELMVGTLRATGVEAQLLSQKDRAYVVKVGGLAVVRVLVPAFEYERACRILEEAGLGSSGDVV